MVTDGFNFEEKELLLGGDLIYYPNFIRLEAADQYFQLLLEEVNWQQEDITLFGKKMPMPRLMAWYGDANADASYSRRNFVINPWTKVLLELRQEAENLSGKTFQSVLLNLYRDGQDSVGWHADTEEAYASQPIIVSLSLGATRKFQLREIGGKTKGELQLKHGSALIMQGDMQKKWQHQVPKTKQKVGPRINLTFRNRN